MDEVTAASVRTVSKLVESATGLSFVFGMAELPSQLALTVGELTFASVFAAAVLLKASAQLGLVPVWGQGCQRSKSGRRGHVVGLHSVEGVSQTHRSVCFKRKLGLAELAPGVRCPDVVGEPLGADALRCNRAGLV